jgi:putative heme-binding domain-containing protein
MVVVKSLDDVPPEVLASAAVAAPSGPTRPFVRSWTMEDLAPRLEHAGHGRSVAAGKELFGVLSCNRCHRMNGEGGQVGPDLVQVKQKLSDRKATLEDVLREIIEPSKVVEEKFRAQTLVLTDGRLVTGIVEAESDQEVRMRVNPLDGKEDTATVIPKEQIQERVPSEVSLMPMGLLNTLSDEEVLDLLAYVSGAGG